MTFTLLRKLVPVALVGLSVVACGSDTTGMSNDPPVGSYSALIFVTQGSFGQTNQLGNGGSLNITLANNGTTSGHLHLVASNGTPALDADMAGTWTIQNDKVTFTQAADTFMNDLVFTFQPIASDTWYLVASQTIQGTNINITLANKR